MTSSAGEPAKTEKPKEAVLTPFECSGEIDYDKICNEFGCKKVDQSVLDLLEKASGKPPHHLIRRRISTFSLGEDPAPHPCTSDT